FPCSNRKTSPLPSNVTAQIAVPVGEDIFHSVACKVVKDPIDSCVAAEAILRIIIEHGSPPRIIRARGTQVEASSRGSRPEFSGRRLSISGAECPFGKDGPQCGVIRVIGSPAGDHDIFVGVSIEEVSAQAADDQIASGISAESISASAANGNVIAST